MTMNAEAIAKFGREELERRATRIAELERELTEAEAEALANVLNGQRKFLMKDQAVKFDQIAALQSSLSTITVERDALAAQIKEAQEDEWEKWSIEFEGDAEVLGGIIRRQAWKIANYFHRFKYQNESLRLVTAERDAAIEAEREACAQIVDSYAVTNRFKPSDQWKQDQTATEVYETGAIDASVWAAQEIRARSIVAKSEEGK